MTVRAALPTGGAAGGEEAERLEPPAAARLHHLSGAARPSACLTHLARARSAAPALSATRDLATPPPQPQLGAPPDRASSGPPDKPRVASNRAREPDPPRAASSGGSALLGRVRATPRETGRERFSRRWTEFERSWREASVDSVSGPACTGPAAGRSHRSRRLAAGARTACCHLLPASAAHLRCRGEHGAGRTAGSSSTSWTPYRPAAASAVADRLGSWPAARLCRDGRRRISRSSATLYYTVLGPDVCICFIFL